MALMRTVEVLFVIIIIIGGFLITTQFAVLPYPRQIFGTNLRELAVSTLQTLDAQYNLSSIVFSTDSNAWGALQKSLAASLPPNVIFNLTVFNINSTGGVVTYRLANSISNAAGNLGIGSQSASCLVTSSNVTFGMTPQKIGGGKPKTLYILNCNDANGWWITGYTGQSLASDLKNLLSPYFQTTILVNGTYQLGCLLNRTRISSLPQENVTGAVVMNTFGEAVPIPAGYYNKTGYRSSDRSYANYTYTIGQRVNAYNWTWVSIVGYPFYYVTNTKITPFNNTQAWGIYGTRMVGTDNGQGPAGLNAFLRGLGGKTYLYNSTGITGNPGVVYLSSTALDRCNYYGIYPAPYQTSTRALPSYILNVYNLIATEIFNRPPSPNQNWIAGATYSHTGGGAFTAIGLTRTPDIRVSVLGLLMYYHPQIYKSEFEAGGTSRLVTLQLAQQGGT
jgi:hypothetical protein